eukprot:Tamp_28450.p2 GENE.Tamp_28450~~Tamp_28450.p2  ORF type:complete len:119 (-),score=29.95 Tamp_28450:370-726(-)
MFSSSWDVISCGADRSWKREKRGRAAWSRGSECILPLVLRVCGICCTRWRSAVKAREEEEEEEEKEIEEDEANAVNKEEDLGGGGGKLEVPTDVAHACAHQLVYVRASSSSHSFIDCQ